MAKKTKTAVEEDESKSIQVKAEDLIESYSRISVPIYSNEIGISKDIIKKYFEASSNKSNYSDLLQKLRISVLNSFTKTDRGEIIKELKQCFKNERLVLVLGAGVSMGFGLPSWEVLLQKLMVTTLQKEKSASSILSKLFAKIFNPSPLIAGRYLQKYFETNNQSFEEEVRKILYQEIQRSTKSLLMEEIVRYCIAPGKSPNLNSIITYNFDDIVEQSIIKSSLDLPFKPIYGQGMDVDTGELPVYHVHGYLPEKGKLSVANQITFGENIYHKQYTDTYSWNNIVQINKFRENNCLFIGTSLTDPNTRRLLDISNQQRAAKKGSHFIFKLKYNSEDVKKALEILLTQNQDLMDEKAKANLQLDETVLTLTETIESFEENDLKSFGIKTIWIDRYSEIPEIMSEIRKT
jgi:NAD-dependent SIR2 family protein deacetylase